MLWNAIQRFGTLTISFVGNMVLARMLSPDDFGCIGMLAIFISLSEAFIDGGFGSALIQKKDASQEDYSTIFYWNLLVAVALYIGLFFCSPAISRFYHMPVLSDVLRATSLVLIINGFSTIQTNILKKKLEFKLIAKINLIAMTIGVAVAIVLAYRGWGVWSLVVKNLLAAFICSILLWVLTTWRPSFVFSWKSFKSLFSFGAFLLISRLLNTLFENIQGLVIGRYYSAKDLGYYTQAKKLDQLPSGSISQIVTRVTFPVFSQIADEKERLRQAVRKNILCTSYLFFPLQILLIVISKDLIIFLFTDKWIESVPYFRILCIYSMLISLNAINSNLFIAMGKSRLYFWVQLIKKIIGIILLLVGIQFGVIGVTWSLALSGIIWWVISSCVNSRMIDYGFFKQLKDISVILISSLVIGASVMYLSSLFEMSSLVSILFGAIFFSLMYVFISKIMKMEPYYIYIDILKGYLGKKHNSEQ